MAGDFFACRMAASSFPALTSGFSKGLDGKILLR
jgi:hypothetical protein